MIRLYHNHKSKTTPWHREVGLMATALTFKLEIAWFYIPIYTAAVIVTLKVDK